MGVVSGLVMSYQFGTNWSRFSDNTGPVLGPLLGYEVLTAFFLEAGFLGVMLFGMGRVGPGLHFAGDLPGGRRHADFRVLDPRGQFAGCRPRRAMPSGRRPLRAGDWWAIIFNPSFPYRFAHTVTGAYLTTAMIVGAVGAWHVLRERHEPAGAADVLHGDVDGRVVAPAQASSATCTA